MGHFSENMGLFLENMGHFLELVCLFLSHLGKYPIMLFSGKCFAGKALLICPSKWPSHQCGVGHNLQND